MSDIPTGPVSLNDQIRNILTDLIAELRGLVDVAEAQSWPDDEVFFLDSSLLSATTDRAEARLRDPNARQRWSK